MLLPSAPFCSHYVPGELLSGDAGMCSHQGDRKTGRSSAGLPEELGGSRTALHIPSQRQDGTAGPELHARRGLHGPVSSAVSDPVSWIQPGDAREGQADSRALGA